MKSVRCEGCHAGRITGRYPGAETEKASETKVRTSTSSSIALRAARKPSIRFWSSPRRVKAQPACSCAPCSMGSLCAGDGKGGDRGE